MEVNFEEFYLRPIQANDNTKKFSLGDQALTPLKHFLQKDAWDFHDGHIAKTYVLLRENSVQVWGYITLMAGGLDLGLDQRPETPERASRYSQFPAVKIARLAVDQQLWGYGFGRFLLEWALGHIRATIMPHIGCRFIIVDSKQTSISFYQHHGFTLLVSDPDLQDEYPAMFLDLAKTTTKQTAVLDTEKLHEQAQSS